MDDLRQILESLEERELDFVTARSKTNNDKQAYEEAGVSRSSFYEWDKDRRDYLVSIALRLKRNRAFVVQLKLDDAAAQAADTLIGALNSKKDHVKIRAAEQILDRTAGKPTQKQQIDVTSKGQQIEYVIKWPEDLYNYDD